MSLKNIFRPTLLKKFLLAFFIVTMIPLIIAEYFTMKRAEEELKSLLNEEYYLIIDQLRRTVDEVFIYQWLNDMNSIAGYIEKNPYLSDDVRNTLMDSELNQQGEILILAIQIPNQPQPFYFMKSEIINDLYTKDAELVARLFQFSGDREFADLTASVKAPIYLENSDLLCLPVEFPVQLNGGSRAILRGVFNLNTILDFISTEISIGAKELYIVNDKGQVIFGNENAKFASGDTLPYAITADVKRGLAGEFRLSQIVPFTYNDERYLGNFAISQYLTWGMIVADSYNRAYAMVTQAKKEIIIWVGIAILLCIIFSIISSRYFSSTMQYLAKIASKIGGGDFDVKFKVKSRDEMGDLAKSLQDMAGNLKDAVRVKEELFAIQQEVKVASRIQQSILPFGVPEMKNLSFGARYIPMEGVAGDFYDFFVINENTLGVLVADVSGHGIPAAMISTMVKVAFSQQRVHATDTSKVLNEMNSTLSGKMEDQFLTASYVHLDLKKKKLNIADAGHLPLLIWRRGEGKIYKIKPKGMIIGFMPDIDCPNKDFKIKDGDRILMYTDGITEAANPENEQYGEDRLTELMRNTQDYAPDKFIDELVKTLREWINRDTFEDDLTMVVMDIGPNHQSKTKS